MNEQPAVYPPAPWNLRGSGIVLPRLIRLQTAERMVPPGIKVVCPAPGQTVGGVLLATYGAGSTLRYHELIVFPAIVYQHGLIAAWISHIYVDDPASAAGGREIWGLSKELAEFRPEDGGITAHQGDRALFTCRIRCRGMEVPVPIWMPAWGQKGDRLLSFSAKGHARASIGRMEWDVPKASPFSDVIQPGTGSCFCLEALELTVGPPRER